MKEVYLYEYVCNSDMNYGHFLLFKDVKCDIFYGFKEWIEWFWLVKEDLIFYLCEDIKDERIKIIEGIWDFELIFFMRILKLSMLKSIMKTVWVDIEFWSNYIYVRTIMRTEVVNFRILLLMIVIIQGMRSLM